MGVVLPPDRAAARAQVERAYAAQAQADPGFAPHAALALERREELGRGGMGVVYRVVDHRLGREAALKLALVDAPEALERFRREARITARLDHPAIPPVYEAGTTPRGEHYLLMRLIQGASLSERIRALHASGPPPVERAGPLAELLGALVQVGEAVAYAHSQGVVHRDLKPSNVMLGTFGEVLVLDWGLALARGEEQGEEALRRSLAQEPVGGADGLTQAGAVLGTLGYMPPEQADGQPAGPRADVFALGAILTEVLCGRPPIAGETAINKLNATVLGKIACPSELRAGVPADLDAVAARALATDPGERTSSAEVFVADLRAWLAGAEVGCYRYGLRERALRAVRRRPGLVLGVALTGLVALAAMGWRQALTEQALAEERRSSAEAREAEARAGQTRLRSQLDAEQEATRRTQAIARAMELLAEAETRAARGDRGEVQRLVDAALASTRALGPGALGEPRFVLVQAAQALARAGALEGADALLRRSAALNPPGVREHLLRFEIELDQERAGRRVGARSLKEALEAEVNPAYRSTALVDLSAALATAGQTGYEVSGLVRGGELLRARDPQAAEVALTEAIRARPDLPFGNFLRAQARLARRDELAALEDLNRCVELRPRCVSYQVLRYQVLEALGDQRGAISALDGLIALVPEEPALRYDRGCALLALEDYAGARRDFDEALRLDPKLEPAWVNRAILRMRLKDYAGALVDCERARELAPRDADAYVLRAQLEAARGDHAASLAVATQALELAPDHAAAAITRGYALYRLKRHEEAIAAFRRAEELSPGQRDPSFYLASSLQGAKRFAEAEAAYSGVLERSPRDVDAWSNRAQCRAALGRLEEAVADYTRCLELRPGRWRALAYRGRTKLRQGRLEEALEDLDDAVGAHRSGALPRRYRIEARLHAGDLRGAEADVRFLFLGHDGSDARDLYWRGWLRVLQGRRAEAIADFEASLKQEPEQPELAGYLAKLRAGEALSLPAPGP
ncbi:MAG: tetratricopeptide repeat protein [Planctomycetota bacterium]